MPSLDSANKLAKSRIACDTPLWMKYETAIARPSERRALGSPGEGEFQETGTIPAMNREHALQKRLSVAFETPIALQQ